jgi:hypothetical protein
VDLGALGPILFGVIAVGVLVGGYLLDKKRRERLMKFALMRGWTYVGEDPSLVDRWPGEPFGKGDHRRARNVLTGTESGRPFTAFDYSYQTHSTDSKGHRSTTTHRWTVCVVPMPAWLGPVQVVPENLLHRMADAVGLLTDIELESEAFNRKYRVSASSAKLASDILTPRTMEYLIAMDAEGWRTCGTDLVSFGQGRLDPAEVVRTAAVLGRVQDGIPGFVWTDAGVPDAGVRDAGRPTRPGDAGTTDPRAVDPG